VLLQIRLYQPLTQMELAERVTVTAGGISRMLTRLEKEGYIKREQDWKIKTIRLTKKGEAILQEAKIGRASCRERAKIKGEDGIRDRNVTGVQTCALPIYVLLQIRLYQPLTQMELAERVTVTAGGISRMLTRLEKEGYIKREQDWKIKTIRLTKKGEAILQEAMPAQLAFQTSLFEDELNEEELKTLYALITRVHKYSQKKQLPPI